MPFAENIKELVDFILRGVDLIDLTNTYKYIPFTHYQSLRNSYDVYTLMLRSNQNLYSFSTHWNIPTSSLDIPQGNRASDFSLTQLWSESLLGNRVSQFAQVLPKSHVDILCNYRKSQTRSDEVRNFGRIFYKIKQKISFFWYFW